MAATPPAIPIAIHARERERFEEHRAPAHADCWQAGAAFVPIDRASSASNGAGGAGTEKSAVKTLRVGVPEENGSSHKEAVLRSVAAAFFAAGDAGFADVAG
jgi:hypothetical protein